MNSMKKWMIMNLSFLILGVGLYGQEPGKKPAKKYDFSSMVVAGLLEGEAGSALQVQTINGWNYGKWFTGLGTGLDYYIFRSVPLFISANRYLNPGTHRFHIQGDVGMNFPWISPEINRGNNVIRDDFKPGLYWNGGIGYSTCFGSRKNKLVLTMGYSYKHMREIKERQVFCINPPCPPLVEKYDYHLRRLSLRVGWQFMSRY